MVWLAENSSQLGWDKTIFNPDYTDIRLMEQAGEPGLKGELRKKMYKIDRFGGGLFQMSERIARQVVGIAAYRLERDRQKNKGANLNTELDLAYEGFVDTNPTLAAKFAKWETNPTIKKEFAWYLAGKTAQKIVFRTQTTGLRPSGARVYQGNFGKLFGSLRSFSTVMLLLQWSIARQLIKASFRGDKAAMKDAANQWFQLAVPSFIFAGVQGMPYFGAIYILYALSTVFDDEGEEESLDQWLANRLAPSLYIGPFSSFTDTAIQNRVGFRNMLLQDNPYRREEVGIPTYLLETAFGPAFSILRKQQMAIEELARGDYWRAAGQGLPTGLANIVRAADPNFARNRKGDLLVEDAGIIDRIRRGIGFSGTEMQANFLTNARMYDFKGKADIRKRAILLQANLERFATGDSSISEDTKEAIKEFNKTRFAIAVKKITPDTLKRSWKAFERRRRSAEHALEKIGAPFPAASEDAVNRLIEATGLK
jgi:hypothetical protein